MAVEVSTSTSSWLDSSGIWLSCINKKVYTVQMRDCPSIKVKVRVGHLAPANKTAVRRCILFADDELLESTFANKTSPALLLVNNSCNFKFYKDAASGNFSIGREPWAVLVWSFAIVPGATFQGRPDHINALDLPGMPVHNLNFLDQVQQCSCLGGGSIFVQIENNAISRTELTDLGSDSDEDDDQSSSEPNSDEDEHYTSIIQIRGSTYGEHYRQNLKDVQSALRQCPFVPVRLLSEEDNPMLLLIARTLSLAI
ncbi:uncharacterized protein LOC110456622 [Mizuhopecten yessoensis]|uniref:uncharacterized protein LOC110456622 n=1 Tax=Mizuhopecten yessoensis TaxID=6573 RepID=UPI000B45AAA9|nr:uncharacterized protein LOC110456622 [Mizuhopecten yessoensis]